MDDAERMSCQEYLPCLFILVADGGRFQGLTRALDKQYLMDKDAYLTTMPQVFKLLEKYKAEVGATEQNTDSAGESGVSFAQDDDWQLNTTCYICGEHDRGVNDCPDRKATYTARKANKVVDHAAVSEEAVDVTLSPPHSVASVPSSDRAVYFERFQRYMDMLEATKNLDVGFIQVVKQSESGHSLFSHGIVPTIETTHVQGKYVLFAAVKNSPVKRFNIDSHKMYLYSCATYHSAFVRWMLDDVKTVTTVMKGNCNAGVSTSNEKVFNGLWNLCLNEQGIVNLLSIPRLEKDGYTIDYNTNQDWVVTTPERKCLLFKKDTGMCEGMPYLDVQDNHEALVLLQTVREKFVLFTERQVNLAIASRDIQARVAHPTDEKFKHMISRKSLDNCTIVFNDVTNTSAIFGPN